ncbi:uncharacterized protein N7483_000044 [Penicillium malachiteum]|uniref:uncharacterized protein n=1 Tax=Penicillium malachiteum TaxID=1324776 RepID=UPI00254906BF|nr:uncharacterized protein N7483_000044 [Penicillium malachiteum]KAJ5734919.1 hypothetical protein N7483_000044 [Penicillium malachiteum]
METLAETSWDVVIAGTGLAQSLLALCLSRSGKNVLHLDQNPYYGGTEAAFSLDEAQEWVNSVNQHPGQSPFEEPTIFTCEHPQDSAQSASSEPSSDGGNPPSGTRSSHPKLAASRAYTLSLSPYFLYTRSQLISILISSKVYRQLDFMAVGSWWIHSSEQINTNSDERGATQGFHRVPGNREDVFADTHIGIKSKRALMRFLRHISKPADEDSDEVEEDLSMPLGNYLSAKFDIPQDLQSPLLSLSLSQQPLQGTLASYAIPRIKRHLASIGALGPGFGGVISKYGGGSEILQVACRASAVGGGVYALGTGIQSLANNDSDEYPAELQLSNGEVVKSKCVVGSLWDLPPQEPSSTFGKIARSITVVSSNFVSFFPVTVEGAPTPASAILMFPGEALGSPQSPPVYFQIHSSDTGDCPREQSIIYGSVSIPGQEGHSLLERAVEKLLTAEGPDAIVLWSMRYNQLGRLSNDGSSPVIQAHSSHVYSFPPPSLDLAFEDETVDMVKQAWLKVAGSEVDPDDFMIFDDREGTSDE